MFKNIVLQHGNNTVENSEPSEHDAENMGRSLTEKPDRGDKNGEA